MEFLCNPIQPAFKIPTTIIGFTPNNSPLLTSITIPATYLEEFHAVQETLQAFWDLKD